MPPKQANGFRPAAVDAIVGISGDPDGATELEIVDRSGGSCVSGGCSGIGSLWIDAYLFGGECNPAVMEPAEALVGCDIGFVPFSDDEVQRNGICCCEGL